MPCLTTAQAAAQLGLHADTLKKMRHRGEGPPFVRVGARAVRYEDDALREWLRHRQQSAEDRRAG